MEYARYHDEVLHALQALGKPSLGRHMANDRGSALNYVGVRVPALRRRVREGFTFYDLDPATVLAVWDDLWMGSDWGDVLFAAQEYYGPIVRKRVDEAYWPVMKRWIDRVDNWCHSDGLSGTYSRLLAADPASVMPVLERWSRTAASQCKRPSVGCFARCGGRIRGKSRPTLKRMPQESPPPPSPGPSNA